MLRRWVAITLLLRRTVAVLLRLLLMISLMTAEPTARDLGLESTVLVRLPLADVAKVNVFALHRDQRNPAQLEPCARFRLHHLRVLASWTDARRSIAFLLNFRRAPKDDRDEEAKVLSSRTRMQETREKSAMSAGPCLKKINWMLADWERCLPS